jgi:hypothetical protein
VIIVFGEAFVPSLSALPGPRRILGWTALTRARDLDLCPLRRDILHGVFRPCEKPPDWSQRELARARASVRPVFERLVGSELQRTGYPENSISQRTDRWREMDPNSR